MPLTHELFAGMTKVNLDPGKDVTLVQQQFDMQAPPSAPARGRRRTTGGRTAPARRHRAPAHRRGTSPRSTRGVVVDTCSHQHRTARTRRRGAAGRREQHRRIDDAVASLGINLTGDEIAGLERSSTPRLAGHLRRRRAPAHHAPAAARRPRPTRAGRAFRRSRRDITMGRTRPARGGHNTMEVRG